MIAQYHRTLKDGSKYNHLFPIPDNRDTVLLGDGNVIDTVQLMGKYITKYQSDTAKLAPMLIGRDVEETLKNDWNFVYNHIQYQLDKPGEEQLRRPARAWKDRITGVDCDCYTIFLSTLLLNQGITPVIRIVQIPVTGNFHHVYPIVEKSTGGYYFLDCVLDQFNYEKPFTKNKDFTMNSLGIPIVGLHGTSVINDPIYNRLQETLVAVKRDPASYKDHFNVTDFIKQLEYAIQYWNTPQRQEALNKLAEQENKLSGLSGDSRIYSEMAGFSGVSDEESFGLVVASKMAKMAAKKALLSKSKSPKANRTMQLVQAAQDRLRKMSTFNPADKKSAVKIIQNDQNNVFDYDMTDREEVIEDSYINDTEDIEDEINMMEMRDDMNGFGAVLLGGYLEGKQKRLERKEKRLEKRKERAEKKGNTKKAENLSKKLEKNEMKQDGTWKDEKKEWRKENDKGFWNGIKNAGKAAVKAIIKLNPLTIAIRNGFLFALKINMMKMSSRLKWGYATQEQAEKKGMSKDRWQKSVDSLKNVEKLFVDTAQGSAKALKNAILSGKKGNIEGLKGLGNPAAVIAAAIPFIVKVINILKKGGLVDESVDAEKLANDIVNGKLPDKDISSNEFDDVDTGVKPDDDDTSEGGSNTSLFIGLGTVAGILLLAYMFRNAGTGSHKNKTANGLSGMKKLKGQKTVHSEIKLK